MIKKILTCALLLVAAITWAENPNLDYPTDTIEGVVIYRYPVAKSIGLYRVSVNFSVPQSTIIEWNPFLKERGLQYGDTLYIPTGRPIVAKDPAQDVKDSSTKQAELNTEPIAPKKEDSLIVPETLNTPDSTTARESFKVALLLPLQAQSTQRTESMDRFVDFYEGCLIALKDAQDSTRNIDLYLYDTDKGVAEISRLMENELKGMNAIIGPAYQQQVAAMDTFIRRHQIPTIIPFTSEVESLNENPFLYLFNTTAEMEADTFLSYLEKRGELTNCVLVEGKKEDINKDIRYIREQIEARELPHTQTTLHDILMDSVFLSLKPDVENIVIFNSTKFANIQVLLQHLINGKADCRVSLYSQFAWQKERILVPQVYTTIFATDTLPALADYETTYSTYFGHRHASMIPRYDLLGYDVTRQFLNLLMGIEPYPGLQSDIRFSQIGEGGHINSHITLIHK